MMTIEASFSTEKSSGESFHEHQTRSSGGNSNWILCTYGLLVHCLCLGLQNSIAAFLLTAEEDLSKEFQLEQLWIGALHISLPYSLSPILSVFLMRFSSAAIGIVGGLLLATGCLLTSFSSKSLHIVLSYGILVPTGMAASTEAIDYLMSHYFRPKMVFTEVIMLTGNAIGMIFFPLLFLNAFGEQGWRTCLHFICSIVCILLLPAVFSKIPFFNRKRKLLSLTKQMDCEHQKGFVPLKQIREHFQQRTFKVFIVSCLLSSFGNFVPLIYIAKESKYENLESNFIFLLYTFCGTSYMIGVTFSWIITKGKNQVFRISPLRLYQTAIFTTGICLFVMSSVHGFHGYAISMWVYGACLGSQAYTAKIIFLKYFDDNSKAQLSIFHMMQSGLIFSGILLTGYINERYAKSGYYFCASMALLSASLIFLPNEEEFSLSRSQPSDGKLKDTSEPANQQSENSSVFRISRNTFCACYPCSSFVHSERETASVLHGKHGKCSGGAPVMQEYIVNNIQTRRWSPPIKVGQILLQSNPNLLLTASFCTSFPSLLHETCDVAKSSCLSRNICLQSSCLGCNSIASYGSLNATGKHCRSLEMDCIEQITSL